MSSSSASARLPISTSGRRRRTTPAALATVAVVLATVLSAFGPATTASARTVGQGFTVTTADLAYILKQIKIAEAHVAGTTSATGPCGALLGTGANQVPDALTSYGLRTVDGSCNNLVRGRESYGAADRLFPRLTRPTFQNADERSPFGAPGTSSYAQKSGSVVDAEPRAISNLVVDQTSANPAAVAAAGYPVRTQNAPGKFPCTTDPDPLADPPVDGVPANCVPTGDTLFIPNVTTDVGLSPPYNSMFTLFGQFFDHGIDQTVKGGGTVFIPLKADDPLRTVGPDGKAGTGDEVPASQAFMVLTRAQNQPGPDGKLGTADDVQEAANTDSPYVDQSQTYTSHPSHQVFLREYVDNSEGRPVSTGALLGGSGGMATWADVKKQSAELLGLRLSDKDVLNVPQLAVDPYGKFLPGPARGLPMYVTPGGMVEGDTADPVPVPADVLSFKTPFLTDIAHNADPSPQDADHNPSTPPVAPTPDADGTASADFAHQAPGTYDDEMLDAHFCAGDGRVNENIGLTAIHQVFHSEHDRLVAEFKSTLAKDVTTKGVAALKEWKLATGAGGWNGERLFQAARFVAEMEYQHLVFEEFGRKVQPALQPFHVYHTDVDPAVAAEFAHAVYRFGHSMLTETISRTNANGSDNSISLLDGFLNPPSYTDGGSAGTLTPDAAAGSIVMGMSNQTGNELDEFMTGTLRNNLVGLPLDLAATNIARAREAGIPSLNEVRRQVHDATGDAQMTPYTSWADFGQNVKHPESVVNFVAAYGTYPTITAETTLAGRRKAAQALVDPGPGVSPDADALDFMNSAGPWADKATGLEDVDLWIGGLAEKTNLFGGLLGSTFNYVFEGQMTDLQNGDRFYYLARTPGMNLRAQLEGNSFSEMIIRNTDGTDTLKADVFATADCKFQLANLAGTAAGYATAGPTVADDPATVDCDESKLLLRKPDGTIQYRETNTVDPAGINGQAVYNGTDGVDRVTGGNDNDTFWGAKGDDVIEGAGGDDVALGGEGDDRITDASGADVHKGGPGDDYINTGIGNDIMMAGDGQDFTNGGANDNETFAGPDSDFVQSGDGADVAFGDGGDDWIQGGSGQDLLIGDHGAPFFDDPAQTQPGNDVFVGQVGENDYDAEGGDDIMAANAAVDRYAGAAGFDWVNHQYDTVGADDDMNINRVLPGTPLPIVVNRDRWQEVEASSGSALDDVIRGDDLVPSTVGGGGFTGCDVLDQTGIDRVAGLGDLVPAPTTPLAPVEAASAPGQCPLDGPVWGAGNILLGGLGSDTLQGRGGDDVLDGDRSLRVRISVRDGAGTEIGSTDLMEKPYRTGSSRTLAADVAAGVVDPGDLVVVREVVTPVAAQTAGQRDSAVFGDVESNYTVTTTGGDGTLGSPGSVTTVVHNPPAGGGGAGGGGARVADGTDTLRNIERLVFSDTAPPVAPVLDFVTGGNGQATVNFLPPPGTVTGFTVKVVDEAGAQVGELRPAPADANSLVVTGLTNGTAYRFQVSATNAEGTSPYSPLSSPITPKAPATVVPPDAPTIEVPTPRDASVTVRWAPPVVTGGARIDSYQVRVFDGDVQVRSQVVLGNSRTVDVTGLTNGTTYTFDVAATNSAGTGAFSARSEPATPTAPAAAPGAPTIGAPVAGNASATVTWTAPASTGGSAITAYSVDVYAGTTLVRTGTAAGDATSLVVTGLTNGTAYTFEVSATNAAGTGAASARSTAVTPTAPATAPGAPTIGAPTAGNASATVRWTAPAGTGGSPITGYTVRAFAGTTLAVTQAVTGTATTVSVSGLTNGTAYTFEVAATNAAGTGAASARSTAVTPTAPATAPGAPTIGAPTAGNASATVRWTAPASTGGSPITGYSVRAYAGTTLVKTQAVTGDVASVAVTALTNGTAYTFDVRAVNAAGTGAASARSTAVTPTAPATAPGAPTIGAPTAANASATVRWTAPATTGGSPITGYSVRTYAGTTLVRTQTVAGSASSVLVTGLTNQTAYTFDVRAVNAVGTGAASARSATTTPRTEFVLPTLTARTPASGATAVSQTANLAVTFSEAVNGLSATTYTLRQGTTAVPAVVSYSPTSRVATLDPGATLLGDRTYTVAVSGVRDAAGNTIATTTWTFVTGPAPVITATSPSAAATGVRRNANVTATFSETVTGVSTTSVRLTNAATGAVVAASVTFNPTTRVLTLDPAASLAAGTDYRVTVTGGTGAVRDAAGNPLVTRTWTFRTGTAL
ncbi:Fibronectin type III domain-containing protein [Friedmanniella luteola]|uniref:Fibronectin type III domain-containing protein n=1 Tax=Friedmanniella luteola TaxID=546871 RepID=A0A1H1RPR3_9ACTN|nr:fibronectin type III domain-containing protein [Friedmanniella luteola]SDS37767.1 Fibronectin type III domain-containing protein [Friedmanniella luteola]